MKAAIQGKAAGKNGFLYFVTASADGKPAWYYVQVEEPRHKAFQKQMKTGALDLAQYGRIIRSGWGAMPPEPIAALMEERLAA